jgi:arylsulfatase A-like enzyme
MIDHDKVVGKLLGLIDSLNLRDKTLVQYSTDNGPREYTISMHSLKTLGERGLWREDHSNEKDEGARSFLLFWGSKKRGAQNLCILPSPYRLSSLLTTTTKPPDMNTWPDAGMTPFRSEKNSNCASFEGRGGGARGGLEKRQVERGAKAPILYTASS